MAGSEVGSAYLSIIPSTKGFAATLGKGIDGTFVDAGRRGGETMGDEAGKSGKRSFVAAGAALAGAMAASFAVAGAAQITQAVGSFLADAIGSASGLEQSIGGVDAVFKESADTIHEWAKGAADGVGLAQAEYNELATVIGAQLKNMGVPLGEVAVKTNDLVELGADLAAQFGGSTSEAVSALSSLLRGERDPIERYGVSINDASIQAKKAEMGLSDLTGEADRNANMQATLALLTQQTADAQGAFARESGTLAGAQQRLTAELENMKTEIGTALMPVVTDLLGVFRDQGIPILQQLADWFTANKDAVYNTGIAIADASLGILGAFLAMAEGGASLNVFMYGMLRGLSNGFFNFALGVVLAADTAFGWIPGVGDKLDGLAVDLKSTQTTADVALGLLEDDARDTRDAFSAGRDAVTSLREAVQNLDGKRATVFLDAKGNATKILSDGSYQTSTGAVFRAAGGPVAAGRPYIVGEREPELFVPTQAGRIYNQRQLAALPTAPSGGGTTQTFNIYGADDPGAASLSVARRQLLLGV
ncbi:hypothetical protein [Cellulomonas shaoxiangyii]|uniref:Phage tail tape measure protein n=1 Tax=Cellulomonas shaoxiangyii TaxID=2566013 RepID=A0A4P7SJL2_9CELL|nr:hypothetical protein [Cellulomonas shaoxiangyii]QCB93296.1 hypothetical protein E5225_06775 [Cellulomonas shaoxiangyii]TGY82485.1 hypothetical protein E5226_13175 [Cellulomonas shaoxiangyii]